MKRKSSILFASLLVTAASLEAVVVPPAGYVYSTQLLGNDTQGCVAAGPGGTFAGVGPGFTANAQSVVLARESGDLRLVASGFNSINDCAYDADADILYVTDNADNADFGIVSLFAAQSGDTIFAIPSASTASGLSAPGLELLPPDSLPSAASIAVDAAGDVFVSDSIGGGAGSIVKISAGTPSTFVAGLDLAAGLALDPASGDLFSAQTLSSTFENQLDRFDALGVPVPPIPFAAPSFGFGSYDAVFDKDGRLLVTGAFGGDVLSFDPVSGASAPFVSGLNFASGATVDARTGRVQLLSSTFSGAAEDRSLHRFTPIEKLVSGKGDPGVDCGHEFYGLESSDGKRSVCTDGDACDSDGIVNDRCSFPVGFCLNIDDPDLPTCPTTAILTKVAITTIPFSAAVADATAAIAAALPLGGPACFFSDGFIVPVKITGKGVKKNGKGKIKVKTENDINRNDKDTMQLICQPAP